MQNNFTAKLYTSAVFLTAECIPIRQGIPSGSVVLRLSKKLLREFRHEPQQKNILKKLEKSM